MLRSLFGPNALSSLLRGGRECLQGLGKLVVVANGVECIGDTFSPADALALLQNIERRFPKIRQIAQNQ
jgi:16S rRNA G1207 methylase RsmC